MIKIKEYVDWRWQGGAHDCDDDSVIATRFANHCLTKQQTEIDTLRAQLVLLLAAQKFRPMSQAPKDGTEIIIKVKSRAGIPKKFLIGHWASGCNDYQAIKGGWYFWNGCLFDDAAEPLEWLPLPEDSQA